MRMTGTIDWFSGRLCFGFITGDDGKNYFVHRTAIGKTKVRPGNRVEFTPGKNEKGDTAEEVVLI